LREFHGRLIGEGEQCGDGGGLAGFFEGFDDAVEEASAVDAVDFGAVEFAGGEAEVGDEGAEFVVDHAGKDDAGECAAVEDDALGCAGAMFVDGAEQKFEVEGSVVGDEGEVAAEVGEVAEDGLNVGLVGDHVVGDSVDGGGAGRNGASGVDEGGEGFAGFAVGEAVSRSKAIKFMRSFIRDAGAMLKTVRGVLNQTAVVEFEFVIFSHDRNAGG